MKTRTFRMRRLAGITLLLALIPCAAADSKSPEEKKQEEIRKASRRLAGLAPAADPDSGFIRDRARELLEQSRRAPAGSFGFKQLTEALDDLLDAGEELSKAIRRESGNSERDSDSADTARELEKAYFRVAQAEYFARVSRDPHGPDYVRLAGRMYQAARREYDNKGYRRARRLAEAAKEIVNTMEHLAQAAVPVREPPRLEQ